MVEIRIKYRNAGVVVDRWKTTMYASAIIEANFEILDTFRFSKTANQLTVAVPEKRFEEFGKLVKKIEDAIRSRQSRQPHKSILHKR